MGLVFLFLKLYPFFGISLGVLSFDLARNFKRKGNKAWIGMLLFCFIFFATSVMWAVFRGDKNADLWFGRIVAWFHHG